MSDEKLGCGRPTGGPVGAEPAAPQAEPIDPEPEEAATMAGVRVGQKAPDFTAPAYKDGGFTTIKLSDYLGKWVVLCFYPGDFTFV